MALSLIRNTGIPSELAVIFGLTLFNDFRTSSIVNGGNVN